MKFEIVDIEKIIETALEKLNFYDSEILDRSLKEETINHRLAVYIEEGFKENPKTTDLVLFVDVEFNRMNGDQKKAILVDGKPKNIRPDIIVHQRSLILGKNFLVVECKRNRFSLWDIQKLDNLMSQGLNYQHSVLINYAVNKPFFHFKILDGKKVIIDRKIKK